MTFRRPLRLSKCALSLLRGPKVGSFFSFVLFTVNDNPDNSIQKPKSIFPFSMLQHYTPNFISLRSVVVFDVSTNTVSHNKIYY